MKGFTLIELLVVIAVLGILVLLAAPRFLGYTKDANVATMQADAKVLSNAALVYNVEEENWPVEDGTSPLKEITINQGESDEMQLDVYPMSKSLLSSQIQNIKGDFDDYGIIKDGEKGGTVYHLEGIEDREGVVYYGTELNNKEDSVDLEDNPYAGYTVLTESNFVPRGKYNKLVYNGSSSKVIIPGEFLEDGLFSYALVDDDVSITHVKFPDTLNKIGVGNFQNSALELIDIPSNVEIPNPAFAGGTIRSMGEHRYEFYEAYMNGGQEAGVYVWNGNAYEKQ